MATMTSLETTPSTDRFDIVNSMLNRTPLAVYGMAARIGGGEEPRYRVLTGLVNGVEVEDGSGYLLMVDLLVTGTGRSVAGDMYRVFVRCPR